MEALPLPFSWDAVSAGAAVLGGLFALARWLAAQLAVLRAEARDQARRLHERIDTLHRELAATYVRHDLHAAQLAHVNASLEAHHDLIVAVAGRSDSPHGPPRPPAAE